ncbi:FAD binding domain-containing protein [Enterovirga sp.]|uniref:FAD binding domain-containing protein n=1 Tax=Enterovirga sp. TaxID=2026350 RepID=UPI0026357B3E|nr:FAD binding domain-containing protein [Enterovirga sp.]MDB5591525.1 cutM [Enterovirga sp.]
MFPFHYHRPTAWPDAIQLLSRPGAVAKMGGCDVLTKYRRGQIRPESVVALHLLPAVGELRTSPAGVQIGAGVSLRQLVAAPSFRELWPEIAAVAAQVASPAIRSAATAVGNVAQGWEVSDLVPVFQVCGAELDVVGPGGERSLTVDDYARQPGTGALNPGEIIARLRLPARQQGFRIAYQRFALRDGFDLPLVSVAVGAVVTAQGFADVRVAAVGGQDMPSRCEAAEAALAGGGDAASLAQAASALAAWAKPPSDFRASGEYRRHLLGVLLSRALGTLRAQ